MKNKLAAMIFAISFISATNVTYANLTSEPGKCPSIAALISVGIETIDKGLCDGWNGIVKSNRYDTKEAWTLIMFAESPALCGIPAKDEVEARKKMLLELNTLQYLGGPMRINSPINNQDTYACVYQGNHSTVYTFTPPITPNQLNKIMQISN